MCSFPVLQGRKGHAPQVDAAEAILLGVILVLLKSVRFDSFPHKCTDALLCRSRTARYKQACAFGQGLQQGGRRGARSQLSAS